MERDIRFTHYIRDGRMILGRKKELFSPRQKEALLYLARGDTKPEVAEKVGIGLNSVKSYIARVNHFLGTSSVLETLFVAIEEGEFSFAELVERNDFETVALLSPRELHILDYIVEKKGAESTNKEIGKRFGISENSVHTYLERIYHKLTMRGRIPAVLFYAAAAADFEKRGEDMHEFIALKKSKDVVESPVELSPRQREILEYVTAHEQAQQEEIARVFGIAKNSVRTHFDRIYKKFNVHSRADAILLYRERQKETDNK